jgi:hypothetical protein
MSVDQLFSDLNSLTNTMTLHPKTLFRGQSVADWRLLPSFARIAKDKNLSREKAIQLEREGVTKFQNSSRATLPLEETISILPNNGQVDFLGWFSLMQHFSAPTRTLDWSLSPWVALYFAASANENEDGAIWLVDYAAACDGVSKGLKSHNLAALIHDPAAEEFVAFSTAWNSNPRIEAQQGRSSICTNPLADHVPSLETVGALKKLVVPKAVKGDAMVMLNAMNVNARTLFPGADGLGRSLREFYCNWDQTSRLG